MMSLVDYNEGDSRPAWPAPQPGIGEERGFGELLLSAVAGSLLAPFVQAVATKAGEDVYAKIKDLLGRRGRDDAAASAGTISLADPARAIVIQFPQSLSQAQAAKLAAVRLPAASSTDWVLVHYDTTAQAWHATVAEQPLTGAIELTPRPVDAAE